MQFRSLMLLLSLFLLLPFCSKEETPESVRVHPGKITDRFNGRYLIEPSEDETLDLMSAGRAVLRDREGKVLKEGRFYEGKESLRLFFDRDDAPDAVFLLSTRSDTGWRGRWGESIKILYRLGAAK